MTGTKSRHHFTHLHTHSYFSMLDGLAPPEALLDAAAAAGMTHLALTDHGTLHGALTFYVAAKERGLSPLLGCELYVARRRRFDKERKEDRGGHHLIVLAADMSGYRNLVRLATAAHLEGFYGKPRIDEDLLAQHTDGLICTSACLSGALARALSAGREDDAVAIAARYRDLFPGRYYIEIQDHHLDEQRRLLPQQIALARRLGLPLVATNDVHYVARDHAQAQEILLAIQTGTKMSDPGRLKMGTQEFFLKTPQEMQVLFSTVPEALTNTRVIAEQCHLDLPLGRSLLPALALPPGQSAMERLRALAEAGMQRRYAHITEEMRRRWDYECAIIAQTGFADYFLLLEDILTWARGQGILVGAGRGSAVGSLVAYCLGLTDVEPLGLGLLFERFLNPDRLSLPDIDSDVEDDRRDDVLRYIAARYGADHVAQISTFGTMAARAALKDASRALGLSYQEVDTLCKLVPPKGDLAAALAVPEFLQAYQASQGVTEAVDAARQLETTVRHASVHASGIVIAPVPLTDLVPLCTVRGATDEATARATQYGYEDLERLGLVKLDILALSNLRLLRRCAEEIARTTGEKIDPQRVPLDDPAIYALLARGQTSGCFQLESAGMRRLLQQMQPDCFADVMAALALYRPGPMEYIGHYVRRKHGQEEIRYLHADLEPILRESFGVIVYQDDVLRIALDLAGLTWGEVDKLRKAMGKKLPAEMTKQKDLFIAGFGKTTRWQYAATPDGQIKAQEVAKPVYDAALAEALWEQIVTFAGYGFNRSHSAAYATLSCQTAYLKAHHPRCFLAALLDAEQARPERMAVALAECRRLGFVLLPPDLNRGTDHFVVEPDGIRYNLGCVRNVGGAAVTDILAERTADGPFRSFDDAVQRLAARGLSRRVLESLVKAGALDAFGDRAALLAGLPSALSSAQRLARRQATGQLSFLDLEPTEATAFAVPATTLPEVAPLEPQVQLAYEKEVLGTYLSPHPLHGFARDLARMQAQSLAEAEKNEPLAVGAQVAQVRLLTTKRQEAMAILTLEDLSGMLPAVIFPRVYGRVAPLIHPDALLWLEGTVTERGDELQLIVDDILPLDDLAAPGGRTLIMRLPHDVGLLEQAMDVLSADPGEDRIVLVVTDPQQGTIAHIEDTVLRAAACPRLVRRLRALLGEDQIEVHSEDGEGEQVAG